MTTQQEIQTEEPKRGTTIPVYSDATDREKILPHSARVILP